MSAWIIAALRLLAQGVGVGVGLEAGQRVLGPGVLDAFPLGLGGGGDGIVVDQQGRRLVHVGGHGRRRRRRALTASDRADIAFIAGIIGKSAAKDFAVQLAARPR